MSTLLSPSGDPVEVVIAMQEAKSHAAPMHWRSPKDPLPFFCELPDGVPAHLDQSTDIGFEHRCDACCIGGYAYMARRHPNHLEWTVKRINDHRALSGLEPMRFPHAS